MINENFFFSHICNRYWYSIYIYISIYIVWYVFVIYIYCSYDDIWENSNIDLYFHSFEFINIIFFFFCIYIYCNMFDFPREIYIDFVWPKIYLIKFYFILFYLYFLFRIKNIHICLWNLLKICWCGKWMYINIYRELQMKCTHMINRSSYIFAVNCELCMRVDPQYRSKHRYLHIYSPIRLQLLVSIISELDILLIQLYFSVNRIIWSNSN